jgi:S-adenosylmethionine hydrolase
MAVITLTTDFGTEDGNVGVMKGIIWGITPETKIADLSHNIAPQNIRMAAFVLERSAFYFPAETVHVVVVDPGVGTARQSIAVRVEAVRDGKPTPQTFVGPDNGVFTPLYLRAEKEGWPVQIVHTDKSEFWLSEISNVFHGRDIFSPVAAHLAGGAALSEVGEPIDDPVRIDWEPPRRDGDRLVGEVRYIDHFGNLHASITREDLAGLEVKSVDLGDYYFPGLLETFGEAEPGMLIALMSSTGALLVAEVNGSAAATSGAQIGDEIVVSV